ncbi:MAG: alpha-E domain-containing protein [Pseudomonadota bacterium]
MLSRAAERVYWIGRYLERAENTARIVQQYSQLLLDMPADVGVSWAELVRIFGAADHFQLSGYDQSEDTVLDFLLADRASPVSLVWSIRRARDNLRNTRDLLPQEAWESVNELNHYAAEQLSGAARGDDRFETLSECIARCLQLNGAFDGTMSHEMPFRFLRLGQHLERADMTSRILDVAATYIQFNKPVARRYGSVLWTNILRSVSGFQMYRQYRQAEIVGRDVIDFLACDTGFPRAIARCLSRATYNAALLPRSSATRDVLDEATALLEDLPSLHPDADAVSARLDELQRRLGRAHQTLCDTWFLPTETQ